MSDKIARTGIKRDNDLMYYIKSDGNVWATPRKQKGQPKGKARKIAETGLELDYSSYIYFLDGDGDVARKERALGGGGRKAKAKAAKPAKPAKAAKPAAAPASPKKAGTKSEEQLDREIEECLAKAKGGGDNGGNGGNGTKPASKPATKTKKTKAPKKKKR